MGQSHRTHTQEQAGGYLWSPKTKRNGHKNQFYLNMQAVNPGDPILCYWGSRLRAYGIAQSACYDAPRPEEFESVGASWSRGGFKVDVVFSQIDPAIPPKKHFDKIAPLLPNKYSPLNRKNGNGLQSVYLAELSEPLTSLLFSFVNGSESTFRTATTPNAAIAAPEVVEAVQIIAEVAGRARRGQGRGLSPDARRAVEALAMHVATEHYERDGWGVTDVSREQSYDLVCSRAGLELRVEVKGTTGMGEQVLVSRNEVDHARDHHPNVALFVVYGITLSKAEPPVASGGEMRILTPWDIDAGVLEPVGYSYSLPRPS